MQRVGIVVIGRNEGQRLVRCLQSLAGQYVVYVDSGSTDGSIEQSGKYGATLEQLDMTAPFTAARARNAGCRRLLKDYPELEYVQFVDGDCLVTEKWLDAAYRCLEADSGLAVVCGRRRELDKDSSVYNMLCDIEWDSPVGSADACGGDAMYRVSAFRAVGGFNEDFIAGEEPELCFRLRAAGWRVRRIDREMTRHDADMHHFKQWWKRCQRSGYAYGLGALEHGLGSEHYKLKPCVSTLFWGGAVPALALSLLFFNPWWPLLALVLPYSYLGIKIYRYSRRQHREFSRRQLAIYSGFLVLQKFPELVGLAQCVWQRLVGQRMKIIEYK